MKETWTKQCQKKRCYSYIPDGATLCDHHLLEKYRLLDCMVYDSNDWDYEYPMIARGNVIRALRKAEKEK